MNIDMILKKHNITADDDMVPALIDAFLEGEISVKCDGKEVEFFHCKYPENVYS